LAAEAEPVVVVLGDFSHEGLTAKIESLGFKVINKNLRSRASNWLRIADLLKSLAAENHLALVFAYVPTTTLLLMAEEAFDSVRKTLLDEIERSRSIFFVYEDNLQGIFEPFPWEIDDTEESAVDRADTPWRTHEWRIPGLTRGEWLDQHDHEITRARVLLNNLAERQIEVAPFRKRSDVTIRMFEVLDEIQAGIFLRLYVPHGRYQSEQFEDFLSLFSRYLREVEGREFSVDVHRTARGTTYVFKGRGEAGSLEDLRDATKRFDDFLTLSQTDPGAATRALERAGAQSAAAGFIVAKYARSIRRLHLEMRHEFERRRLLLNHSLEADLLESREPLLLPLPAPEQPSALFSVIGNTAPVTISLPMATIATGANSQIQELISGGMQYSLEDKEILQLIESLDDKVEALRLRSELDRLKDGATPPDERRTAVQKLKSFLYAGARYVGKAVDEVGTKLLVAYLERLLGAAGGIK